MSKVMDQDQLICSISQQLENLMTLDEELSEKYDAYCYYPDTDYERSRFSQCSLLH